MNPKRMVRIYLIVIGLLVTGMVALGQTSTKPAKIAFTTADRDAINAYYKHEHGNLAPGSLDRKGFPPEIERALAAGNRVPAQLEKQMDRLPAELEKKIAGKPAGHETWLLGHDVLLVRRSDMMIVDVIKNAGWK